MLTKLRLHLLDPALKHLSHTLHSLPFQQPIQIPSPILLCPHSFSSLIADLFDASLELMDQVSQSSVGGFWVGDG